MILLNLAKFGDSSESEDLLETQNSCGSGESGKVGDSGGFSDAGDSGGSRYSG